MSYLLSFLAAFRFCYFKASSFPEEMAEAKSQPHAQMSLSFQDNHQGRETQEGFYLRHLKHDIIPKNLNLKLNTKAFTFVCFIICNKKHPEILQMNCDGKFFH